MKNSVEVSDSLAEASQLSQGTIESIDSTTESTLTNVDQHMDK